MRRTRPILEGISTGDNATCACIVFPVIAAYDESGLSSALFRKD
jgi:hypothetical protein